MKRIGLLLAILLVTSTHGLVHAQEQVPEASETSTQTSDTSISRIRVSIEVERGGSSLPNFSGMLGIDIGFGPWIVEGTFRSWSSMIERIPGGLDSNLHGVAYSFSSQFSPTGPSTGNPIPDLASDFGGATEYRITAGRVLSIGILSLMPSAGISLLLRRNILYQNVIAFSQPGISDSYFFRAHFRFATTQIWKRFDVVHESETYLVVPLQLRTLLKISSHVALSATGWTEVGKHGTTGWSAGIQIGGLP